MDSQGAIMSIGTEWGHNTFIEEDARCVSLAGRQCKQPLSDEGEMQHWEEKKIEQRGSPHGQQNTNGRDGMDEKRLDRYNSAQSPLVKCAKKRGTSIAPRDGRGGSAQKKRAAGESSRSRVKWSWVDIWAANRLRRATTSACTLSEESPRRAASNTAARLRGLKASPVSSRF